MESMARGFESKDVEFQQAEAERAKTIGHALTRDERERQTRRRTIELALAKTRADLANARAPAHKRMLGDALAALEQQLGALLAVLLTVLIAATVACSSRGDDAEGAKSSAPASSPAASAATAASSASVPEKPATLPRVVFLGDSLTAGLGLAASDAYPALIGERLKAEGLKYEVINAGVSGDTSAGGLSRLDWALQGDVRILVVALGGNDALRALPPEQLRDNLAQIIERGQKRGATVVLAGMDAPPNWGRDYVVSFHKVYPALAQQYHVAFVPFLLQGVAGIDRLNQSDGIHPTREGARIVADNVWRVLAPIANEKMTGGPAGR
jgi:acyl-CoA thioesterase-1